MARQEDLRQIGSEGFALIEKFFGQAAPKRTFGNGAFPAKQGRWVAHQVPNDTEMEQQQQRGVMNSREVAARYGGMMVVNYTKGKPQTRFGRLFKP